MDLYRSSRWSAPSCVCVCVCVPKVRKENQKILQPNRLLEDKDSLLSRVRQMSNMQGDGETLILSPDLIKTFDLATSNTRRCGL